MADHQCPLTLAQAAAYLNVTERYMRRLVAEHCTALVSLPTQPPIGSLNVSNAAAIGLYEIARRRPR